MVRNAPASRNNSPQISCKRVEFDASKAVRGLQRQIKKLQTDQEAQKRELIELRQLVLEFSRSDLDAPPQVADHESEDNKTRPGPKPRHPGGMTFLRNSLVTMLESYWPELERLCIAPMPNPRLLKRVVRAIADPTLTIHADAAKHLLDNFGILVQFLGGDRFRNDPRQIANALACAPLSWWTSLKICQRDPCDYPIGRRALKAYVRRKCSALYIQLEVEIDLIRFSNIVRSFDTTDKNICGCSAQVLYDAWAGGNPNYSALMKSPGTK